MSGKEDPTMKVLMEFSKELEKFRTELDYIKEVAFRRKPKLLTDDDMFFLKRAIEESIRHCDKNIEQYPNNNAYKKERDHCFVLKGKIKMLWALTERDKK